VAALARRYVSPPSRELAALWARLPEARRQDLVAQFRAALHEVSGPVASASHGPFTGSHSHPHSALGHGSGDDDGQHEHDHRHEGDAVHDHAFTHDFIFGPEAPGPAGNRAGGPWERAEADARAARARPARHIRFEGGEMHVLASARRKSSADAAWDRLARTARELRGRGGSA
jgi:hypothetical protein